MNNPTIKPQVVNNPFTNFCMSIGAIPTSYKDSLDYYETLLWLIKYLEETVIPAVNTNGEAVAELQTLYVELKDYVEHYFENLDVQEEINNKLDEMASDGTLASIIANYIGINNVNYLSQVSVLEYRPSTSTDIGMQGGCYVGDGNIAQYVAVGKKIQIISLSTGEVLREQEYAFTGHGNSMCYVDGYLYISGLLETGTTENAIYKINYSDLSDYEKIDIYTDLSISTSVNLFTITYDANTERWYMLKAPIIPTCEIYIFNKDFTEYTTHSFDNSSNYGGPIVNTCMFNNYYCIFYNEGKLTMLDNEFNVYKNITIEKSFGSRYASEFEWLSQYNNQSLIFGIIGYDGKKYGGGNFLYATSNLYSSNQTFNQGYNANNLTNDYPKIQLLYVDNTLETADVTRDGSREKPFISLYELSNALLTNDINICYIHGDFTNEGLYINNCNDVKIYNWVQDEESNTLIKVRQLEVENVAQCYLRYIYPLNSIEIKESKTLIKYDSLIDKNKVLSLHVYNTGHLIFDVNNDRITVKNYERSEGIIESTKFVRINGFSRHITDSSGETYTDYCCCRNIKNIMTRNRYEGSWSNPTTYTFSIPRANTLPYVRLSLEGWTALPFHDNMTKTIYLHSGDTLTYTISNNASDSNMVDVTITTTTEKIWDIFTVFN